MADLMQRNAGPRRLRELLSRPEPVLAPGAYDALSARLYAPRRYRRDGWIFAFSGISILFELVQERYSNGSYRNTVLLNPKPPRETTRQRAKNLAMHQKEAA